MASINDRVVADIAWPDWVKPGRMCTSRVQDCTALPQGTLLLSHGFLAADPSARGFLAAYTLACSATQVGHARGGRCLVRGLELFLILPASTWRAMSRPIGVGAPEPGAGGWEGVLRENPG